MLARVFEEYTGIIVGSIMLLVSIILATELYTASSENITVYKEAFQAQFTTS